MFKLQYLRMRSRYMLFGFVAVFALNVLFIMFQNSLSSPAIETLVTETHKQINNFKNFKVKLMAFGLGLNSFQTVRYFFPGQFKGRWTKRISSQRRLFVFTGICCKASGLSRLILEKYNITSYCYICCRRRTQSSYWACYVCGQVLARSCYTSVQLRNIGLSTRSRKTLYYNYYYVQNWSSHLLMFL